MKTKDIDAQFLCKDCTRYNLCEYYHRRRKDSYICKFFHLSVTPQEPQSFEWCTDCKEYDQEKHCCHRWSKVIRDTVEDMKQEPKSEWEQDHAILKAYSDGANEVLDKIRAEIEQLSTTKCTETRRIYIDADKFKENALAIIDKYKGESEDKE